jgi:tRNA C32,U32 (ribose-2'-O)-methylase TrmJ
LEKNAQKRLEPVVKRFFGRNLASRQEIQSLARRVQELEHVVKQHSHPEASVAPAQPSLSSPEPPRSSMGE